jgi:hypothetical protein
MERNAEHFEISFNIDSCIKLASVELPGSFFATHDAVIRIEEKSRREWGSHHQVRILIPKTVESDRMVQVGELIRERMVSLFALVTEADVSASDELMVVDPATNTGESLLRSGFRRQLTRERCSENINFIRRCSIARIWNGMPSRVSEKH